MRSELRGGGATGSRGGGSRDIGSRFWFGAISGGGTKSRSSGRVGSIGGRRLSGGSCESSLGVLGREEGCEGGCGKGCDGGSGGSPLPSPKRPNAPGPGMPFLERGGRLDASSLRYSLLLSLVSLVSLVANDAAATDSWLLLFEAILRIPSLSLDAVESMLPAGEPLPLGGERTGGDF